MCAKNPVLLLVATVLAAAMPGGEARAQDDSGPGFEGRYELWMGPIWWPALRELQPADGRFDAVGLGLGFGFHLPVSKFQDSDLLLGMDMSVGGVDSNIDGFLSTVIARHLFVGLSAKWLFGLDRNVSLDAGFGYHNADISEVSPVIWGVENEIWSKSRASTWVGFAWDVSRGRPVNKNGLFIAAKAHFVDFGDVYDNTAQSGIVLGGAAGQLDSTIYVLEIGYSGR